MATDLDLDAAEFVEAKNTLYTLLSSYTTGSVKASIRRMKVKGIFEAYRKLHFDGMRVTPKSMFREKSQLWNVEEANLDKVAESIERWEGRLDFVEEQSGYTMSEEDKVQGLLQICPTAMRLNLLEEQG